MDEGLFMARIPGDPGPTFEEQHVKPHEVTKLMKFVTFTFETHISNVEPVDRELHLDIVRRDKELLLTCCRFLRAWPYPTHNAQHALTFVQFLDSFEEALANL